MMTAEGIKTYELAKRYELAEFYQETVGNFILPADKLTVEVVGRITHFLMDNNDWVMGYEFCGDNDHRDEYIIYITPIDFLAECNGYIEQ